MSAEKCIGCGAIVERIDGPVHRYMTSAPGCWALFGELCARVLRDPFDVPGRQLFFDTYAVQHPGTESPVATQSVGGHLVSLYAQLECGSSAEHAHALLERAIQNEKRLHWLSPPTFDGALTVADIMPHIDDPYAKGREWAESAWRAWAPHHDQVRVWHQFLSGLTGRSG